MHPTDDTKLYKLLETKVFRVDSIKRSKTDKKGQNFRLSRAFLHPFVAKHKAIK